MKGYISLSKAAQKNPKPLNSRGPGILRFFYSYNGVVVVVADVADVVDISACLDFAARF